MEGAEEWEDPINYDEDIVGPRTKRLLITLPPRSLKSISASVALPAWLLGNDPTKKIVTVSYSSKLATALGRQFRETWMPAYMDWISS